MKKKFTILGCGSSLGSPWINNHKGNLKNNLKILEQMLCSYSVWKFVVSIDTSPDIKIQFLKIRLNPQMLYTHEHADQTAGIFEMRPFFWTNKKKIPVYASKRTIKAILSSYTFCFYPRHSYQPIMRANIIKDRFVIKKDNNSLIINSFDVKHGDINATGYLFDKIAYISDCNQIPKKSLKYLFGLNYLIIDCLRRNKHPSHFNYDDAMNLIDKVKPKKTILTNLHTDLDYSYLKKKLPSNIIPAYDGLNFNF